MSILERRLDRKNCDPKEVDHLAMEMDACESTWQHLAGSAACAAVRRGRQWCCTMPTVDVWQQMGSVEYEHQDTSTTVERTEWL